MLEWNYKSDVECSTGYEDVMDILKSYNKNMYESANDEEKEEIVNNVLNIYRGRNIYPIYYYNEEGIINQIQKCIDKEVKWDGKNLTFRSVQGLNLLRFLFPNMTKIILENDKRTMHYKFFDNHCLKRAIKSSLKMKDNVVPHNIRRSLDIIGGSSATNFHPMKAKALYEKYCPKNGIIYDFSCGFGGRMLGALSSKNNYKYFGVEPCEETFIHLNELGEYIEKATGRNKIFKIYKKGSEDYKCRENYCDFAFSSPPYFNCEVYSDEETQCYNKFNTLDKWFEGYVEPTIKNIYHMLKKDRYYAVNISDFNVGSKRIEFVDKWIEISEKIGFQYIEKLNMKVEKRRSNTSSTKEKQEGIFVFRK